MQTQPNVYFLNLDRHVSRLENMTTQLDALGLSWERVAALDAQQASEEELAEYTDPTGPIPRMGAGARACTVGHFRMWHRFLETDAPVAFILEDDARLSENLPAFIHSAQTYANTLDILNFNRQPPNGNEKRLVVSKANTIGNEMFTAMHLLSPHYGTAGYMITRAAAERLCHHLKRTNVPIDHLLFNPNVSSFMRTSRILQTFPAFVEPDIEKFHTSIQDEAVAASLSWQKKLSRLYYETRQTPAILAQVLLRRAEVKTLSLEE